VSFPTQRSFGSAVWLNTLKLQHNLLCSLSFFFWKIGVVCPLQPLCFLSLLFFLGIHRILALLVLCHFVRLVLAILFKGRLAGFRNANCDYRRAIGSESQVFYLI
jgi:hypothetical protein